ncbi:MAG: excinuclease ABC subunit A [Candidatus Vogelbacteria bacterium CG10_big_fil_rev_8_21_14_0_10_49_38]|uniref:UvrABC system protein A n=1 Tax=Candidatus Vogelbacteria bacterium CG10_big_fil_rev_8_21_14_0_10_49_38 TaxID=1975043 RepID=A0A2H0RI05_9BACT|nr:MAG: excinuclease ABC subunit A [bacterium CG10_49_38]PIR46192.1 MAG: excinuclease ABC subunit A [Candidatus Vogelbacteria bacterium CG10_big_fil_rev_8_21_14_0_10_49_38]
MDQKHQDKIKIKGARTHNLKNISLEIPRDQLTVITGLSGSGKSSLAFDTIFAEGQRRYIESLSAYARQFLKQLPKPEVDEISGLSPAIAIDQKSRSHNPRSTVATVTEIYDYLRVLYARIGRPHCPVCGVAIEKLSLEEIVNFAKEKIAVSHRGKKNLKISITAPLVRGRKGEYYQLLYDLLDKGYLEVLVDGQTYQLRERIVMTKTKKHDIDAVVDMIDWSDQGEVVAAGQRLAEAVERALKESDGLVKIVIDNENFLLSSKFSCPNDGFSFPEIEPRLFSFNSPYGACPTCHGIGTKHLFGGEPCDTCQGARLRREALEVRIGGKNIMEAVSLSIADAASFFDKLKLTPKEKTISEVLWREIKARLKFLLDVGLDYVELNRRADTLSGGEAQRIRLASQLGSRLVGTLYVLDEPTIGLHARDNAKLIKTLLELRDLGNTIVVVEHDEDTIFASDYLVDIGPGAGVHGGKVVAAGPTEKFLTSKKNDYNSLTIDYLRGDKTIALPEKRRGNQKGALKIRGGKIFNIKNLNVDLPLSRLVAITGVSGSGKSSFVYEILYKNLQAKLERRYRTNTLFNCREFGGTEYLSRVVLVDQSPIGRTPRSNPATYTGAFTFIRELFAASALARARGWKPSRFSFNVAGGRCEACQGNGEVAVEMHFLPTIFVPCDVCGGKRYEKETLEALYKGKNIYEVLQMTVEEAFSFFEDIPAIFDRLKTLNEVGLGYLELGQSATTLSGGEAQRVKISTELYRPFTERTIYILDEPTVGLHYEDVKNLNEILQKLVTKGNTVVVIEHNLEVVKSADYVIDLGPAGGKDGGELVAVGTPEELAYAPGSHTGKYLKRLLKQQ